MTTELFIVTRATHFGACLALFGVFAYDRLVAAAEPRGSAAVEAGEVRLRWFSLVTLPVILVSGIAWFMLVAMTISGEAPQWTLLQVVWQETFFGTVCHWRLLFWGVTAAGAVGLFVFGGESAWRGRLKGWVLAGSGFLLGSLAWAGHGLEGPPAQWHLLADVLHLLAAGVWPAGLLPLALRLRELCRSTEPERMAALVRRFSAVSLGAVTVLGASGLVNSWFLVGSWANLVERPYGQWLLVKIILFGVAVGMGAVNFLLWKSKLCAADAPEAEKKRAAARLRGNVWMELGLGMAVVVVVAVLGLLPPAVG